MLALLLATTPTPAQDPQDRRSPAEPRAAELEVIRAEIARLRAELGQARERREGLADEVARLDLELELGRRRLAEVETERSIVEARVERTAETVAELEMALERTRERLRQSILTLYRIGRGGHLRVALSIASGEELLDGLRVLRYLTRRDAAVFTRFAEARAELDSERQELEVERQRLAGWVEEDRRRRAELEAVRTRQARLLATARERQESLAGRTEALAERERRLAGLVDLVVGRVTGDLVGQPIQEFQGVLDWPVEGRVVTGFGPRRDPRYRTLTPHNGLELATASGAAVAAVFPGEVLHAAPIEGYGSSVVVRHPGRVFTIYAGLEALEVNQGAVLTLGQRLGTARGRLYFEIREQDRPADPLDWLR